MEIEIKRCMGGEQLMDAAQILASCQPKSWPTVRDAHAMLEKLAMSLTSAVFVSLLQGQVVGVIAGAPAFQGRVCELQVLIVAKSARHQGIGRKLVEALEIYARKSGMKTLWLGSDDESSASTLSAIDPYEDVQAAMNAFRVGTKAANFYTRLGYAMVGILPDANGPLQPCMFFSKRL